MVKMNLYALLLKKNKIVQNRFHAIKVHQTSLLTQDVQQACITIHDDFLQGKKKKIMPHIKPTTLPTSINP